MAYKFNSKQIKKLMVDKNDMTQKELAAKIGITPKTLRSKFKERTTFTVQEVEKMSEIFKVDPGIFFEFQIPPNVNNIGQKNQN